MSGTTEQKKSRHFTVVARREFPRSPEKVFSTWTDPKTRDAVLGNVLHRKAVKEVDISEGGLERYEDQWPNGSFGVSQRRYLIIRPSRMIVAQSDTKIEDTIIEQHVARQELLLFKPKSGGCEVVASNQLVAIQPTPVQEAEAQLEEVFDIFARML